MISPTPNALAALREHGLDEEMIEVAVAIAEEIEAAAEDVANDTRTDSFDDSTSRGQLLYRRARNRTIVRFKPNLEVSCDTTDNALHIRFRGIAFCFYSAREGLEHPSVQGSATKRRVVDESQLMLETCDEAAVNRLVLMHESAPDGLVRLGIGVLANSTTWNWKIALYDRYAASDVAANDQDRLAYDQLPEAELPSLPPRKFEEAAGDEEIDRDEAAYDQLPEAELPPLPPRAPGEAERDNRE